MKKTIISLAVLGLFAWQSQVSADVAETAEGCIDCHEVDEFEGMDAAALEAAAKQANAENKMMAKATKDLSDEDWKAVSAYFAAEANK
jgi:cytochrome c553